MECGSIEPTLDMYFSVEKAPTNITEVIKQSVENNELANIKAITGRTAIISTTVGRCQVEGNLCGKHETCISG